MPNSAATSVAALPLLSQSSTACCLKVLSNFLRVFLDWITGVFIVALPFIVSLYLCPPNRAGPYNDPADAKLRSKCYELIDAPPLPPCGHPLPLPAGERAGARGCFVRLFKCPPRFLWQFDCTLA